MTAHLLARMPDYFAIRERAYKSLLDRGDPLAAGEAALWLGVQKIAQGDVAEGGGWVARAALGKDAAYVVEHLDREPAAAAREPLVAS